jgi:CheY-like chemotaxis protein
MVTMLNERIVGTTFNAIELVTKLAGPAVPHTSAGDREKAMQAGCDDYDTKPVEITRLLGKMAALLASRAA